MRGMLLLVTVGVATIPSFACEKPHQRPATSMNGTPRGQGSPTVPGGVDATLVQERSDWAAFKASLAADSTVAAAALERYRSVHGLPFSFFYDVKAAAVVAGRVKSEDTEMCGRIAPAFVRRMPIHDAILSPTPVLEFDATGRVLRRWAVPSDVEFSEVVVGVSGDELITLYPDIPLAVYLRVASTGDFRVSAAPPQPLPPEEWLALEDSTWLRVKPDMGMTSHAGSTRGAAPGTWELRGDSGWYVRTDSGPHQGVLAHAVTLPTAPYPPIYRCPSSDEFSGMMCRGFPDGARIRTLAIPTPCT